MPIEVVRGKVVNLELTRASNVPDFKASVSKFCLKMRVSDPVVQTSA